MVVQCCARENVHGRHEVTIPQMPTLHTNAPQIISELDGEPREEEHMLQFDLSIAKPT